MVTMGSMDRRTVIKAAAVAGVGAWAAPVIVDSMASPAAAASSCASIALTNTFTGALHGAGFHTTSTIAVSAAVPAGRLVTVVGVFGSTGGSPVLPSATDTKGNTYTLRANIPPTSTSLGLYILSSVITTALTSSDSITTTFTNTGNNSAASALVFSGASTFEAGNQNSGTGTAVTSNSVNTTDTCDVLVGVVAPPGNTTATFTAGPGFTTTGVVNGSLQGWLIPEYAFVTPAGSYAATGTFSGSVSWVAAVAAFK